MPDKVYPQYTNRPGFQEFRAQEDPLIELEQEEATTRTELTFEPLPRMEIPQENSQSELTAVLQALNQLLSNQGHSQGPSDFRARIREPDTYHGDRSLDAALGWIRSVERYFKVAGVKENRWIDYTVMLFRDDADVWWRHQEEQDDIDQWAVFKKRFLGHFNPPNAPQLARDRLAALEQTGTVADYVNKFQTACSAVTGITDAEALDRFQRGLHPTIRMQVMTRFPVFVDEAMHLALAVEAAQQQCQSILSNTNGQHTHTHIQPQAAP